MDKEKAKEVTFIWTDAEIELLLEAVKAFSAACLFEGKDWEGVKGKYDKVKEIFVESYPRVEAGKEPTDTVLY